MDAEVLEAMMPYFTEGFGNASQPYAFGYTAKQALKKARAEIAECIGADPDEIYFTSGGSESDNWAIKGTAFADDDKAALITSSFEHHAVLHSAAAIARMGYPVHYVEPTRDGFVTPEALEKAFPAKTRMVSVMTANNELGIVQPIGELAEVAHRHGALFHTDAVQAVGHIPIDVKKNDIDLLSASAHKFNGPKGMGFLYVRKGTRIQAYMDGGAQERKMRAGTENIAGIVGMAAALRGNCAHMEETAQHLREMEVLLIETLSASAIPFRRNGASPSLPGVLSLSFPGMNGETILHRMDLMGFAISTGSACDSVNTEISHVLKAIRLDEEAARGTVRISLGKYNTMDDAADIANALIRIVRKRTR